MSSAPRGAGRLLAACALIVSIVLIAQPAPAATYRLDPKETMASFEVKFLGLFPIRGEFRRTTGMLVYDAATQQGQIEVFIDTTTLEASTEKAQASARGPDFFDVEKHPSIDFKSTRFVFEEGKLKAVDGNLTLVGKTRPVTLIVTSSSCTVATPQDPGTCRAAAELMVRRSDFDMKAWAHSVGEVVTIRIAIYAKQVAESGQKEPVKDPAKEPAKEPMKGEPALDGAPAR